MGIKIQSSRQPCNKAKQQSLNSSADNTGSLPTDLSRIVHAVINQIHTHGASSSSASSLQLKSKLPAFCNLNRSVNSFTALSAGNANCCLVAQCLYVPNTSEPKTPAERKRASRQNAELRQSEQLLDTSRMKVRRQDDDQRQQEQHRDTSKHLQDMLTGS